MSQQLLEDPPETLPARMNGNGHASPVKPSRQSALASMADRFAIQPDRLMEVLKGTVIKGSAGRPATNEEVAAFIVVANQYGLNPFTREIHAFTDSQRGVVPIVGIDGWAHIVNAEHRFDGVEFKEIKDGDDLGVTCTMYAKGRSHPVRVTEWLSECKRNTNPWNTMRRRMLRHKSFMQCARIAFSISGIYDEDEARDILQNNAPVAPDAPAVSRTTALKQKLVGVPAITQGVTGEVASSESATLPPETTDPSQLDDAEAENSLQADSPSARKSNRLSVDEPPSTDFEAEAAAEQDAGRAEIRKSMSGDWSTVVKILRSRGKDAGIDRGAFDGGLTKTSGFGLVAENSTVDARVDLYFALVEKRWNPATGAISSSR